MTSVNSKSTIFIPNNLIDKPKFCVDCGASDVNHYSYGNGVYLCMECAKIHDNHLNKYNPNNRTRYSKSCNCSLVDLRDSLENPNVLFNKEFERFLPEFFQKMGAKTPQVC